MMEAWKLTSYAYDGRFRRTTKTDGATTTHFYYNDRWKCVEEWESTSTTDPVRQYVWGARSNHRDELVLRDRDATGGGTLDERLYCLMDYFDPTAMVDTSGSVVERYAFTAFGLRTIMEADWTVRTSSAYAVGFAFHGQFLDTETGYYDYGYRYYSPNLGRWLSRDPIAEQGGVNLYGFTRNSAINANDWLGLAFTDNGLTEGTFQAGRTSGLLQGDNWYGATPRMWTISSRNAGGEVSVTREPDPDVENCFCVEVESVPEYDIETSSYVANDLVGTEYTQAGLTAIRDHEERRRTVYDRAYTAFLLHFEAEEFPDCRVCGLKRAKANKYKKALEDWITQLQNSAHTEWETYVTREQMAITDEQVQESNNLITGMTAHPIAQATALEVTCPEATS